MKQKLLLKPELILKYFITNDEKTDTLITCKTSNYELTTTDFDVYYALTAIKPYDNFNFNKIKKFFEVVDILSYKKVKGHEKPKITDKDVEELRKKALRGE